MYLSTRQRKLLSQLIESDGYLTAEQLADGLDASTRTVHRELKELSDTISQFGLGLVKKTGAGIRLEGTKDAKDELYAFLIQDAKTHDYTPHERILILLCRLIQEQEPVKLLLLADEANVTVVTVAGDLFLVEDWGQPFGLTLIRRRGYGIELVGTEAAKRQAIGALIAENMSESERIGLIRGEQTQGGKPSIVRDKLMELLAVEQLPHIASAIRDLPMLQASPLADASYADLVLRLAIIVKRKHAGMQLESNDEQELLQVSSQERETALQISDAIAAVIGDPLNVAEQLSLIHFLRGAQPARVQQEMEFAALEQVELHAMMRQLVLRCKQALGIPFSKDRVLMEGLMAHLEPAVHRLRQKQQVYNPHVRRIKEDYSELFAVIERAMQEILPNASVPDDEISFLVMHFAASVERTYRAKRRIRTIVFCSSGIGTSKMLASRLQREIPEIDIVDNVSVFEVHLLDKSKYDLIISTVMLPIDPDKYIWVSPLLSSDELKLIRQKIMQSSNPSWEEMRSMQEQKQTPSDSDYRDEDEESRAAEQRLIIDNYLAEETEVVQRTVDNSPLRKLKTYMDLSLAIVSQFQQRKIELAHTLEEVLADICHQLEDEGIIHHADEVVQRLIQRQQHGGLGIPMTSLALLHTRSENIEQPIFRLYRLTEPLQLEAMDYSMMTIHDVLLLLSPAQVRPEALEILSEISSFFIDRETVDCFATHDEMQMRGHLEDRLFAFCYNKMTRKGNNEI